MSTFSGIIKEIPFISVDRFDNDNLNSKIFFLSHCHTDHMVGLCNCDLPGPLYVSPISAVILQGKYKNLKNIHCLQIGVPTPIHLPNCDNKTNFNLVVTTIPAGHCPGSVMFLFELDKLKILYTGDFRLQIQDIKRLTAFKDVLGNVIPIDTIYIDSTFFNKNYMEFPTQSDSIKMICHLINEWITKGENYIISLKTTARYGSEYLFKEIYDQLKQKIHVNDSEIINYRYIPELDHCITNNGTQLQIHGCYVYGNNFSEQLSCRQIQNNEYLRIIRPTAIHWKNWQRNNLIFSKGKNAEIYRVCYSSHSSYSEIKDFLEYLKPKSIELNVVSTGQNEKLQQIECLNEILLDLNGLKITENLTNNIELEKEFQFNYNFLNIDQHLLSVQDDNKFENLNDKDKEDSEELLIFNELPKRIKKL